MRHTTTDASAPAPICASRVRAHHAWGWYASRLHTCCHPVSLCVRRSRSSLRRRAVRWMSLPVGSSVPAKSAALFQGERWLGADTGNKTRDTAHRRQDRDHWDQLTAPARIASVCCRSRCGSRFVRTRADKDVDGDAIGRGTVVGATQLQHAGRFDRSLACYCGACAALACCARRVIGLTRGDPALSHDQRY